MSDEGQELKPDAAPKAANEAGPGDSEDPAVSGDPDAVVEAAEATEEAAPPTPEEQIAELKEKLLRALAETENVRRRSQREIADTRKYAAVEFARDIVSVSDNLKRALDSVGQTPGDENPVLKRLVEGVDLTERELAHALDKHGVKSVDPLGEKLDPNLHQAMMQVDDGEAEAGTIVQVMQIGYTIHDRLLRAAMVGVAKGPRAAETSSSDPASATDDQTAADDGNAEPGDRVDTEA